MNPEVFLSFMHDIEKLKCNTRHSYTSSGRKESVAEHSWRLCVMALLCADEYPELDMQKVLKMCLVHDFGEALTGDVPSFYKTEEHEAKEDEAVKTLLSTLPQEVSSEYIALFAEMNALTTAEAKLFKALDNMEAVISHNEADLSTWIEREYTENLIYGEEVAAFSPWTKALRDELKRETEHKIKGSL